MSTMQMPEASTLRPSSDGFYARRLTPTIGADIMGVDLSKPMNDEVFAKVLDTWHQSLVILFRDQHLTEDDQVRFGKRFGPPAVTHTKQYETQNPAVMLISNVRENGRLIGALPDGEQERPAMASMLYSLEVPSKGRNTLFANAYRAYETLPNSIKQKIDGRKALNAYDYDNASTRRGTKLREGVPSCWHPIVRTHPATGKKALYVNRLMTIQIEGMSQPESDELLNVLFHHQERREFIYEHVWRTHDLLLWDNRCALHARTDFSADERRLLRRLTILGEKPV
jgi:taurine dioxygenase